MVKAGSCDGAAALNVPTSVVAMTLLMSPRLGAFAPTQYSCASMIIPPGEISKREGPCTAIYGQPSGSAEPSPVGLGFGFSRAVALVFNIVGRWGKPGL